MNNLSEIIFATLKQHSACSLDNEKERSHLADVLAADLLCASWKQLAAVTGASVEYDNDGQLVLYTGCHVELPDAYRQVVDDAETLTAVNITKPLGMTQEEANGLSSQPF